VSGENFNSQQNSASKHKVTAIGSSNPPNSARHKLKNQTQYVPSGSFVLTGGPGALGGGQYQIGANSELCQADHAAHKDEKNYHTESSDQHMNVQHDQANAQGGSGHQNLRVQSERYLTSTGNGSQQSQSSKILKTKKKNIKN